MDSLFTTIQQRIYDLRYNRKEAIRLLRRDVKFAWQRLTRGWDDSETWNLDTRLSEMILPRLKRFKEIARTYPMDLSPNEWQTILDKMILAHEWHAAGCEDRDVSAEHYEKVEEGLMLFSKYYGDLWW